MSGKVTDAAALDDRAAQGDFRPSLLGLSLGFWKTCLASYFFFTAYYMVIPVLPLASLEVGAQTWQMGYIHGLGSTLQVPLALFLIGPLINKRQRRPFLLIGALVYMVSALILIRVETFVPFLIIGAFTGVGVGFFSSPAATMVLSFVPEARRGEALGIYGTFVTIATSIGPPLVIRLISISFTAAYLAIAFLSLAGAAVALSIREPRVRPADAGSASLPGSRLSRVIVPSVVPPALVIVTMCLMYGSLLSYFPKYALDQGVSNPGFFFTFMAAAIISIRFWAGKASDRIPKIRFILPGMLTMILAMFLITLPVPKEILLGLGAVFGFGYGTVYPVTQALMAEWAGPHERGNSMAMFSAAFTAGIGLGPMMTSPILARWGFPPVFVFSGLVGGVALLWFVRAYLKRMGSMAVASKL